MLANRCRLIKTMLEQQPAVRLQMRRRTGNDARDVAQPTALCHQRSLRLMAQAVENVDDINYLLQRTKSLLTSPIAPL